MSEFFPDLDIWVFRQNHVRLEGGAVVVRDFAPDHWVLIVRQVIEDFRPYILMHSKVASLVDVAVLENYFCLVVTWTLAFRLFLPLSAAPFP